MDSPEGYSGVSHKKHLKEMFSFVETVSTHQEGHGVALQAQTSKKAAHGTFCGSNTWTHKSKSIVCYVFCCEQSSLRASVRHDPGQRMFQNIESEGGSSPPD